MKFRLAAFGMCLALSVVHPASAGDFDQYEGDVLAGLARANGVTRHENLTLKALDALPTVLSDTRAAFFVVKTGQGNYARVLATPALRKPAEGGGRRSRSSSWSDSTRSSRAGRAPAWRAAPA